MRRREFYVLELKTLKNGAQRYPVDQKLKLVHGFLRKYDCLNSEKLPKNS